MRYKTSELTELYSEYNKNLYQEALRDIVNRISNNGCIGTISDPEKPYNADADIYFVRSFFTEYDYWLMHDRIIGERK